VRRPDWPAIDAAFAGKPAQSVEGGATLQRAAVAIVLRDGPAGIEVLFIRRAEHPNDPWSGQIAFPGGGRDPGDADTRATATPAAASASFCFTVTARTLPAAPVTWTTVCATLFTPSSVPTPSPAALATSSDPDPATYPAPPTVVTAPACGASCDALSADTFARMLFCIVARFWQSCTTAKKRSMVVGILVISSVDDDARDILRCASLDEAHGVANDLA